MSPPLIHPFLVIEKKIDISSAELRQSVGRLGPSIRGVPIEDIALTRGVPIEDIALTRHFIGGAPTICRTTEPS